MPLKGLRPCWLLVNKAGLPILRPTLVCHRWLSENHQQGQIVRLSTLALSEVYVHMLVGLSIAHCPGKVTSGRVYVKLLELPLTSLKWVLAADIAAHYICICHSVATTAQNNVLWHTHYDLQVSPAAGCSDSDTCTAAIATAS